MNLADLDAEGEISDRIVEFDLSEDRKTLHVYECCDMCFEARLTKRQVGKLIAKLDEFHAQMADE